MVAIEVRTTYKVEVRTSAHRLCAADQLRCHCALFVGIPWPRHQERHDRTTNPSNPDEWILENVVGFCPQDSKKKDGIPQWKAYWEDFPKSQDT